MIHLPHLIYTGRDQNVRISRISEAYYTQLLDPQLQGNTEYNEKNFPVTVCEGIIYILKFYYFICKLYKLTRINL